ncbi:hypothetical protein [Caldilinea sp.]|uniref:hypothetical protein n=1 Tax=Caldilinea sp. TaxID=2293560 RepID=UPI0021DC7555|nr:hypothetical protein [Caldilinea sp.]GIV70146.1 MAG: hypothetical protein KatS3mg048_3008 [Caldilinea sp.]
MVQEIDQIALFSGVDEVFAGTEQCRRVPTVVGFNPELNVRIASTAEQLTGGPQA